jgi:hypothetical protein
MIDRLRRLLASASGRRFAAVLAGAMLLVQFLAAGHLHLPGHELERRGPHAVCEVCVAADRTGVAPPAVALRLPPAPVTDSAAPAAIPAPVAAAPAAYSSRAPPRSLA